MGIIIEGFFAALFYVETSADGQYYKQRHGSVVRSGAGWVVDGIFGPRSVFTLACHVSSASKGVKEISR